MGKSEQNYTKNEALDILRCRKFDQLDNAISQVERRYWMMVSR